MAKYVTAAATFLMLLMVSMAPAAAVAQTGGAPPLLPHDVGSLHGDGPARLLSGAAAAAAADPASAALLREDGLTDTAEAQYLAGEHRLAVHAYRFGDATGAYAAFTALRGSGTRPEALGTEGSVAGERHVFWTGATVVEVAGAAAATTLRPLAEAIPHARGAAAVPPPLRGYLPLAGLDVASVRYAIGPAGYAAAGGQLPESVIDFSRDAEVAIAKYAVGGGTATLTLLAYPTPQMATGRQKAIAALLQSGAPGLPVGTPGLLVDSTGPLVAMTTGPITAAQAHGLVRAVRYNTVLTINHPEGYVSEVSKAAKLLLGIAYLIGILAVAAVLLALFLGGGRVLVRRMRGKPASSLHDEDFISLRLR